MKSREFVKKVEKKRIFKSSIQKNYIDAVYFNMGFNLLVPILGGFFLGFYLDRWLKTGYVFLILGITFGIIGAFYNLWQSAKK